MTAYVYRCYDAEDVLLYIGQTGNPEQRMATHRTSSPWWPQVHATHVDEHPTAAAAIAAEAALIGSLKPMHNRRHNPDNIVSIGASERVAIGRRIKAARNGRRRVEVARELGISVQALAYWEQGQSMPAVERQAAVARVLGVPWAELFRPAAEDAA